VATQAGRGVDTKGVTAKATAAEEQRERVAKTGSDTPFQEESLLTRVPQTHASLLVALLFVCASSPE
jgi:hypothetical protein